MSFLDICFVVLGMCMSSPQTTYSIRWVQPNNVLRKSCSNCTSEALIHPCFLSLGVRGGRCGRLLRWASTRIVWPSVLSEGFAGHSMALSYELSRKKDRHVSSPMVALNVTLSEVWAFPAWGVEGLSSFVSHAVCIRVEG